MSFVHLHVHSEYSVLDGLSKVTAIVDRAKELGQPAVALTDHGVMFGVIDFFNAAKKAGIKPLIGMEGYLARRTRFDKDPNKDKSPYHLLLLAQNQTGYQNLLKLASLSQLEGFYYRPRVDKELLAQYSAGLIVTTGCGASEIPRLIVNGQLDEARRQLGWYVDVFGRDRFFIELQMHDGYSELININRQLLQLAREFNLKPVATNDAHYIRPEDAPAQDLMICIGTGSLVSQTDRMRMTDNSYYLKSRDEMAALFSEVPAALTNTLAVAEMCEVDLSSKGYHLPVFELPPGVTPQQELRRICEAGLKARYGDRAADPEVRQRLDYELEVIHHMGFDTYFLIVADLTRFARERDIWWNIRGSGASSIVAYTSGITNLDPLPHKLIFERFLNPGRISMPDIDMDFPDDRRAEMIDYAVNKYGRDKVAQIITFGTLGARAAIRDTGRALNIPLSDVDSLAKLIPNVPGKPVKLAEALEQVPEFKQLYETVDWARTLVDRALTVEGTVRSIGTHAAGVVISDRPLVEYTPLHRPTKSDGGDSPLESITQFEMGVVDAIGLLKVDFLGLITLSIMRKACDLIKHHHGVELNLNNIPTDDRAAFELMSRGDVLGVFQVEGGGMRRMLMEMRPSKFEHIVAGISLFRPGPMEYIPTYIARMHGEEPIEYKHPKLQAILEETYGIIVYQEQIIQIAVQLAGYKPGEADEIRKAVGKKIKEKIEAHKAKFIHGAVANGVEQAVAEAIYADIEYFARYGFNKAHAADYAVLTCQTAYLKAHYPVEYMTALMTCEKSVEKIGLLIIECRRLGIDVRRPDVNCSDLDFTIETAANHRPAIRFGMASIKGVGEAPVRAIVDARRAGGPFKSLEDFCRRVDLRVVNRRALEALIKVGAFEDFGYRTQLLDMLDRMLGLSNSAHRAADAGQLSLFGALAAADAAPDTLGALPKVADATLREKLAWEKELIGAHVSEHPVAAAAAQLNGEITHLSSGLNEEADQHRAVMLGMVVGQRVINTKKGEPMGFVQLEDVQGVFECVVFPRLWKQTQGLWQTDKIVLVRGTIDTKGRTPKILVDSATDKLQITEAAPDKNGRGVKASAVNPTSGPRDQGSGTKNQKTRNGTPTDRQVAEPPARYAAPVPKPAIYSPKSEIRNPKFEVDLLDDLSQPLIEEDDPFANDIFDPMEEPAAPTSDRSISAAPIAPVTATAPDFPIVAPRREPAVVAPLKPNGNGQPPGVDKHTSNGPANGNGSWQPPARIAKVIISRSGDGLTDAQRVGDVHRLMCSQPGPDRFCFIVMARGNPLQLDFPNDTTTLDDELIEQLKLLPGVESVQVSLSL